jgi:hypothetical protein
MGQAEQPAWKRQLATKVLVWNYLFRFEPGAAEITGIGRHLSGEVGRWKWEWADRHARFDLFDAGRGPRAVASEAIESNEPRRVLESAGLSGPLAGSGFAAACFREAAQMTQERLERSPSADLVKRLIDGLLKRMAVLRSRKRGAT